MSYTPGISGKKTDGTQTQIGASSEGDLRAVLDVDKDIYGSVMVTGYEDLITETFVDAAGGINATARTLVAGGAVTQVAGMGAIISTGTDPNGAATMQSRNVTTYRSGHELRVDLSIAFDAAVGVLGLFNGVGIFDDQNGFAFGRRASDGAFGILLRNGGVDTFVPQASWNLDPCLSGVNSRFLRSQNIESLDLTKYNVFRIRIGYLGASIVLFEIMTPTGKNLPVHILAFPNTGIITNVKNPFLPLRAQVIKTAAGAGNYSVRVGSWRAAISSTQSSSVISPKTVLTGPSVVGIGNSFEGPLNAGATITGAWEDLTGVASINILASVEQTSALGGAIVQFSNDGQNPVRSGDPQTIVGTLVGGVGLNFAFPPEGRFFRILYTAGAVAGNVIVQAVYQRVAPGLVSQPIGAAISDASKVGYMRAVLTGRLNAGTFPIIGATSDGRQWTRDYAPARVISGVYAFSLSDTPGVAAAGNRFLTIFNPIGSGKTIAILRFHYDNYSTTAPNVKASKILSLLTAASGGSLAPAATIAKKQSTYPNPIAEVRTANPTVTLGADITSMAPAIGNAGPASQYDIEPRTEFEEIVLQPGEGVVLRQIVAGSANETLNLGVEWMEYN